MPSISTATAARTSGPACPTCSPRSPIICRNRAGSRACRGALRSSCRKDSTTGSSRGTFRRLGRARLYRRADGGAFPEAGDAILFFPSGASGPAFLVTENFIVLKRFNNSDAYALAVAELSDRLRGLGPIRGAWPANDFQPSRDERIALQRRLADLGYKVAGFRRPFRFRPARRGAANCNGGSAMIPDGHPSRAFLDRIGVPAP